LHRDLKCNIIFLMKGGTVILFGGWGAFCLRIT
jgi:hypothetical protein